MGLEPEGAAINKSGKSVSLKVGKIVFKVVFEGLVHKGGAEVGRVGDDKIVMVGQQLVNGEIGREVGGEGVGRSEVLGEVGEIGGGGEKEGADVLAEREVVEEGVSLVLECGGGE